MRPHAILTILPSGIHAAGATRDVWVPLDPMAWDATVAAGFSPIREEIRRAIDESGFRGRRIKARYFSKTSIVELLTLPLKPADARDAANLRLREAMGGANVPSSSTMGQVPSPGNQNMTTLLLASDHTETIDQVAQVVTEAGGNPVLVLPVRAGYLRSAVAGVLACPHQRSTAVLWIDRHGTAIAGGTDRTCTFARLLSTSLDLLAEAIQRASRETGEYSFATALDRLTTIGIPDRGSAFDPDARLDSDHVLPLLQPALQRLAIEVKQTLRFGLPEGEATRVEVIVAGPGARVPGLAGALGAMIETEVHPISDSHESERLRWESKFVLGITPTAVETRRTRSSLVMAAVFGGVAAAAAIVGDAFWSTREIGRMRTQVDRNTLALEAAERAHQLGDRLTSLTEQNTKMETLLRGTVGDQPAWSSVLSLASRTGIVGLEIQEITGGTTTEGPGLSIRGQLPAAERGAASVSALVDVLSASPIISRVRVGSTRLAEADGVPVVQFTITLMMKPLPAGTVMRIAEGASR